MFQPQQPEYTCLDDRRLELHSVMNSVIKEAVHQKAYIPNSSLSPIHRNKHSHWSVGHPYTDSDHSILRKAKQGSSEQGDSKLDRTKPDLNFQQNIWTSRVLQNGARDQRWFDKLQDYRNGV
ncbi:hypothetical protein [Paenibacillus cucumis (ex Kampfer et al. 2016)]|uniref:Uncharacterized protein n=1 Tax=Paenibacillus cucumis (ex Kampfer et al. 2016) TaxID=1776858 RepID=A0ABS7KHG7_9BACL|nr:hypothetical protein [Paenibacillus cucumis (ex Kampfer et al. 2016)]MBY0203582.1 hypothetical protein [Paenibacillus cucumis (ex Kampfer et al. 2016)]